MDTDHTWRTPDVPDGPDEDHGRLVESDELVEEISIDGMCGVY